MFRVTEILESVIVVSYSTQQREAKFAWKNSSPKYQRRPTSARRQPKWVFSCALHAFITRLSRSYIDACRFPTEESINPQSHGLGISRKANSQGFRKSIDAPTHRIHKPGQFRRIAPATNVQSHLDISTREAAPAGKEPR